MDIAVKVVACFVNSFERFSDFIGEKTGKTLVDRMTEAREKEEKMKEESPIKWASKKLLEGTIKGIIGGSMH